MKNFATIFFKDGHTEERPLNVGQESVSLDRASIPQTAEYVDFSLDRFLATAGDDGFYLYPGTAGKHEALTRFSSRADTEAVLDQICIPFCAKGDGGKALLAIATGMALALRIVVGVKEGHYYLRQRFMLNEESAYEDPALLLLDLDGEDATPSGIACRYRRYQLERGACLPLSVRAKTHPVLLEAAQGPEVRVRMAWKPVPSPVLHQTDENEPPLHVALTFSQVEEIVEEFHRQGIEHAEFCLVGWNKSGHDGRFPDLFPVEPLLGGEEALRKLIAKAKNYGYLITGHTNLVDSYTIAKRWRDEYMLLKKDGAKRVFGSWGGGAAYYLCPKMAHEKYAGQDMADLEDLGFRGIHYIDVMTDRCPEPCHDPRHPLSEKEAGEWRGRTLALAREALGGSGSEGGFDFCVGSFDYVLYAKGGFHDKLPDIADEHFPFWFIAYHGILLYNAFCSTVNSMIKKDKTLALQCVETGSRPIAYFHSKFMANGTDWMGQEDLSYPSSSVLSQEVALIKRSCDDYQELKELQFEFIKRHEQISDGVVRVTYESGAELFVNYKESEYKFKALTLPGLSWKLSRP